MVSLVHLTPSEEKGGRHKRGYKLQPSLNTLNRLKFEYKESSNFPFAAEMYSPFEIFIERAGEYILLLATTY